MNTDKIVRKSLELISQTVISLMPRSYFTSDENANKYMITGDKKFSYNKGNCFTCGFGKAVITPDDVSSGKYFIAGYDSNNPATGVLDDMYARAVYIDDNTSRGGVILCAVDAVGISRKDINDIRKLVLEDNSVSGLKSINICATHSHSAIDTQGLWGEKLYKSGRKEEFMTHLKKKTAEAIIQAYKNRKDGKLYYSFLETQDLQFDCRTPDTYDRNLTRIRFEPFDSSPSVYMINFASHAELLGDLTKNVSADFPCYLIKEIERENQGSEAVFFNGAIGGMISAKEIKKIYRNQIDCEAYTKQFGKTIGELVNSMNDETEIEPIINIASAPVKIAAQNFVLILARLIKVLNNDISRTSKRGVAAIHTEVGYLELGNSDIGMYLIPGELFPELYNGEFMTEAESGTGKAADYKVLSKMGGAKHHFVIGLCNDELGYIIPDNDFVINERMPYINKGKDRFGRDHYEETNSTGRETARTLLESSDKLILKVK
ncbi:MAG: hypothetical protein J6B25_05045 [Clostridia bacterium]|nr:hypothetical protein [Clostridia bacterium]